MSDDRHDRIMTVIILIFAALLAAMVLAALFAPQCSVTVVSNSGRVITAACPAPL